MENRNIFEGLICTLWGSIPKIILINMMQWILSCFIPMFYLIVYVLVAQSCLTLCDLMGCSPPGSSVHGILQARILEWVATLFSRRSSWPRDRMKFSCIAGSFTVWATREAHMTSHTHKWNKLLRIYHYFLCKSPQKWDFILLRIVWI